MRKLAALALVGAAALCGQSFSNAGSVQGKVTDTSGAAVAGVRVTVSQTGSGAVRTTLTSETGEFRITGLPVGNHTLRLEKEGFATADVQEFAISLGQTVRHSLVMQLSQVMERLEVRDRPDALDVTASSASTALGGDRIEESPASNRNYLNFVLVAPGVAPSAGSNAQRTFAGQRSAAADSGFSFGGLRGRNNSMLIDGMDNRDETTGGIRVGVGLEMVQEFRVTGTGVSAEFGGAAGGIVNVVTRSGTNLWHGDVTFFGQASAVNARNPEVRTGAKPKTHRYQPGVSLNGPARKDRTFFSFALEQQWDGNQEWSDAPEAHLAQINRALLRPEFARAGVKQVYRGLFDSRSAGTEFSMKWNHQIGSRHSLSSRYAFSRERDRADVHGVDNFADQSSRGSSLTRDHSLVGSWMMVAGPHLVHELRGQFARRSVDLSPNTPGAMLEVPGVLTMGQSYRLNAERTEDHTEIANSLSWSRSRHQISGGASLHQVRLNARMANRFSGIYLFPDVQQFAAARPDVFIQAFGRPDTSFNTIPVGAWVQEKWQPHANLTFDAGLRLDWQTMPAPVPGTGPNLAPRLGLAWRPFGKSPLVVRASYGLFYDRYLLGAVNDLVQKDGVRASEQYLTGEAAVRAFRLGLAGTLAAPLPGSPLSTYQAGAPFPPTHGQKLTTGIERGFGKDTTLTAEYSWVRGLHLPRIRNAALALPPAYRMEQTASSSYQGVSVSLNRRMSRELAFLVAYNGGRTYDDASDFDEHPRDPSNPRADWARSRQHQSHRLAVSALFELPFDDWNAMPGAIRGAFKNLIVGPILTLGAGRPINPLETTDLDRTGAYPISARPAGFARNSYLAPPTAALNLRLLKGFPVREGRAILQVGIEAFNLTNHTNPLRVSQFYSAAGRRLDSFHQSTETLEARQLQFVIQFEY